MKDDCQLEKKTSNCDSLGSSMSSGALDQVEPLTPSSFLALLYQLREAFQNCMACLSVGEDVNAFQNWLGY